MGLETQYQQTLDYLYSFVDYSLTHAFPAPENFDLDRIAEFLEYLGNPQLDYPIIHIAGTKGKGSVAALCASALSAAGYRAGLYTSPHLSDYAERIQIDGEPISHAALIALVEEIRPYLARGTKLTTFEITTALAFLYFARQGATVVVAEVGLGGRLDATNVTAPKVTVITSISYDHTAVLGDTLAQIAAEKAGIIKPGVPVVVAPQKEEAGRTIEGIARQREAPLIQVGEAYRFAPERHSLDGQSLWVWTASEDESWRAFQVGADTGGWSPLRLTIPLLGGHQLENAATAYAALKTGDLNGIPIGLNAIQAGFEHVSWPGRFEILRGDPPLVVDSAHNRDSMGKLRLALDEYYPGWPVILIAGASADKDVAGMLAELAPRLDRIIATRSYHPRSMAPEDLAETAGVIGVPVESFETVEEALEKALELAGSEGLILATGSLFLAAAVRDTWYNHYAANR